MVSLRLFLLCAVSVSAAQHIPTYGEKISKRGLYIRDQTASSNLTVNAPVVDLGYSRYGGYYDPSFDIFTYRGVRYASKPDRWQLPKRPVPNKDGGKVVWPATQNPPRCPQSPPGPIITDYSFERDAEGDEDCLFLNVFAPANKTKLPVLFWIHGGGYGQDWAANYDFSHMAKTMGNGFVTVVIQYRLGAFGFASSAEIGHFGTPNAGIHDMRFALEWVRDYIHLFGGDPSRVTIAGESAGGGGVMLLAMANDGSDETSLFERLIVSSPYLPTQWEHDDMRPSQAYYDLAAQAGCLNNGVTQNGSVFECLRTVDSDVLQNASALRPTEQLLNGRVNGKAILSGSNANEGTLFVPTDVDTRDKFLARTRLDFPLLTEEDINHVMSLYDIEESPAAEVLYDSNGVTPPFSTSLSSVAKGWLQAAYNLYAEVTFVCPATWLADAFTISNDSSAALKQAWRYQYSPPPALHDDDLDVLMKDVRGTNDTDGADESAGFRLAFQSMWGRFITTGDPTLPDGILQDVRGLGEDVSAASSSQWARWGPVGSDQKTGKNTMLNLNLTRPEGGAASFGIVDGDSWEGGRGDRCRLWAELGERIPA
ncbi:Secreted lipase [Colletotrichum orbiculare MAFF 240422]|uniref:Carboxylic ester hydrolase n=1 Tax=Colletotrichum orbiculare (strain 104-T / ATCC 96160 / CBS 514.97 / LARS 414 / MAFF 240422) TaxID=1213857 RepID=A0A484G6T4_COLOR|nr:Secreted lipase [Colletotrichum orbiculare MAFF 240422]